MVNKLGSSILLILLVYSVSFSALASPRGNPGKSAMNCVSISKEKYYRNQIKVHIRNRCNAEIFYFYCGDLTSTQRRCGDGQQYYTHASNLRPGQDGSFVVRGNGSYRYGACYGGVGFSLNGRIQGYRNGSYACKKTGDYAKNTRSGSSGNQNNQYNQHNNRHNNQYNNNRYNNNRNNNAYSHQHPKRKKTYRTSVTGKNFVPSSYNRALKDARIKARENFKMACLRSGYPYVQRVYQSSERPRCHTGSNPYYGNKFICSVKMVGTCFGYR